MVFVGVFSVVWQVEKTFERKEWQPVTTSETRCKRTYAQNSSVPSSTKKKKTVK